MTVPQPLLLLPQVVALCSICLTIAFLVVFLRVHSALALAPEEPRLAPDFLAHVDCEATSTNMFRFLAFGSPWLALQLPKATSSE